MYCKKLSEQTARVVLTEVDEELTVALKLGKALEDVLADFTHSGPRIQAPTMQRRASSVKVVGAAIDQSTSRARTRQSCFACAHESRCTIAASRRGVSRGGEGRVLRAIGAAFNATFS